jgi:hypothetical protein
MAMCLLQDAICMGARCSQRHDRHRYATEAGELRTHHNKTDYRYLLLSSLSVLFTKSLVAGLIISLLGL